MTYVLAVDVGTTSMKIAVVDESLQSIVSAERSYPINSRSGGQRDIDTDHWWNAFLSCCHELTDHLSKVEVISLAVSTPGATAFDRNGEALTPAVLFLDGRSSKQAQQIRDRIGEDTLLQHTSNLPVSGGCTASTIVWWQENEPELFHQAAMFGHTNTLFGKRLTGNWGMDPSTASLTALYNTTTNDGTWNHNIANELQIPTEKLPPIVNSWETVGSLLPNWAKQTGLKSGIPVLMGGNDAMCAAYNGGVTHEGAILDVCGTCEIICIGLSQSIPGHQYNIRCHVIPQLWSTLYVLNTGGKALEWFHTNFCRELSAEQFYQEYIPSIIETYFDNSQSVTLPEYEVYLAGDRYSTEKKYAGFHNLSLETNRDHILLSMIRGNNRYMKLHLDEMGTKVPLSSTIHLTGGGLSTAFIQCKKEWMGNFDYKLSSNSSMLGAAQLGLDFIHEKYMR
jgi:xylulokinase